MKVDDVVAGEARIVIDDAAFEQWIAASRHERIDAVRRNGRLAANLDAEAMRLGLVKYRSCRVRSQRLRERVLVGTVAIVDPGSGRSSFRIRLRVRNTAAVAGDVRLPFARATTGARRQLRNHETDIACGQTEESLRQVVGQRQLHGRRTTAGRNRDTRDLDIDQLRGINRDT
jgi:hypothetical protein